MLQFEISIGGLSKMKNITYNINLYISKSYNQYL